MMTKLVPTFFFLLLAPLTAGAVELATPADVFTPISIEDPTTDTTYYGTLTGWPHTYTFAVREDMELRYTPGAAPEGQPVSLLLVRQEVRGVSEVARQAVDETDWAESFDDRHRYTIQTAAETTVALTPGVYRLEVSNPANIAQYQLQLGDGPPGGFGSALYDTFVVHNFYGSWLTALVTWRMLILYLAIAALVWWWRKRHDTHA